MFLQCILIALLSCHGWCVELPLSANRRSPDNHQSIGNVRPSAIVKSIQELGLVLSLQESLSRGGNVVLSPLSIGSLLGVILLASRKDTHRELKDAMQLKQLTDQQVHESYQKVLGSLESYNKEVLLEIASRLFIQFGYSVDQRFLQIAESMYNITVGGVDFVNKKSEARREINQWISDRTHGKIPELITRDFTQDTRFVAVNAVYFNGQWETQFNPDLTEQIGIFRTGTKGNIKIPFMRNIITVNHVSDKQMPQSRICNIGKFDMISLPYKGRQFSMYILMPGGSPSANVLTQIERGLSFDCLNGIVHRMKPTRVSVQIPRMKIANKMSLKKNLQQLNVLSLFSSSEVDLGRMSSASGLFVEDILHEAVIEVTEAGTVAAAATGTSIDRIGGNTHFRMDKPSILFIRDEVNGIILFWAKVVRPSPA